MSTDTSLAPRSLAPAGPAVHRVTWPLVTDLHDARDTPAPATVPARPTVPAVPAVPATPAAPVGADGAVALAVQALDVSAPTASAVATAPVARGAAEAVVFPALDATGDPAGYARGHAAGYAAGLTRAAAEAVARDEQRRAEHDAVVAAARARTERAVAALEAAAQHLMARTAPVLADADAHLVAAAVDLAEAILVRELSDAPDAARAALARALSAPDRAGVVTVRMHPEDALVVASEGQPSGVTGVTVVPDPSLGRGDAVAVYPDGELDARIGSALDRARTALLEDRS